LIAPNFWIAQRRVPRFGALSLAARCVLSRVYLAANCPSDALAGAGIGFAMGNG